jgi:hypothetical protein
MDSASVAGRGGFCRFQLRTSDFFFTFLFLIPYFLFLISFSFFSFSWVKPTAKDSASVVARGGFCCFYFITVG